MQRLPGTVTWAQSQVQDRIQALEREALLASGGVSALRHAVTAAERSAATNEGAVQKAKREAAEMQAQLSAAQVLQSLRRSLQQSLQCLRQS